MNYITFNLNPLPCMSVRLNIFPPEIDFSISVAAAATFGFFVFAPTAIPITGASVFIVGFKNLSRAVFAEN